MDELKKEALVDSTSSHTNPGVARIKPKFLKTRLSSGEDVVASEINRKESTDKKERKGQNRQRKKYSDHRASISDRLCPTILRDIPCSYGEKCKFAHDVSAYMEKKPADIGELCVNFQRLGKCPYSFSCRYASSHISHEEGVYTNSTRSPEILSSTIKSFEGNCLDKEIMSELHKRKYNFTNANRAHKKAVAYVQAEVKIKTDLNNKSKHEKESDSGEPAEKKCRAEEINPDDIGEKNAENINITTDAPTPHLINKTENPDSCELQEVEDKETRMEPVAKRPRLDYTKPEPDKPRQASPPRTDGGTGPIIDNDDTRGKRTVVFDNKLYLAPLTTVGNLPFRRVCKTLGADITCGEMAFASKILQGVKSEWALLRRHESEDIFGVQICGAFADQMSKCTQLINETCKVDFIDINVGCPIDMVFKMGAGSALMRRLNRFQEIVRGMIDASDVPITVKIRTGITEAKNTAHSLLPRLRDWGVSLTTLHGRSREQRYTKMADWQYIDGCCSAATPMPLFGGGDILSYEDYYAAMKTGVSGTMIARGALIKPWLFTEIKEQRHWDISSSERLDILRNFTNYGLGHWGSDTSGVETTRRFLLEWLSFLHRYIPVGLLERVPVKINERPPAYIGRDDLETVMASSYSEDWVKISEMLLGPVPSNFFFIPKHKASSFKDSRD